MTATPDRDVVHWPVISLTHALASAEDGKQQLRLMPIAGLVMTLLNLDSRSKRHSPILDNAAIQCSSN